MLDECDPVPDPELVEDPDVEPDPDPVVPDPDPDEDPEPVELEPDPDPVDELDDEPVLEPDCEPEARAWSAVGCGEPCELEPLVCEELCVLCCVPAEESVPPDEPELEDEDDEVEEDPWLEELSLGASGIEPGFPEVSELTPESGVVEPGCELVREDDAGLSLGVVGAVMLEVGVSPTCLGSTVLTTPSNAE